MIKSVVFDFDGTLIDSNPIKRNAFFDLFPNDDYHQKVVSEALDHFGEESRFVIIREILRELHKSNGDFDIETKLASLVAEYNKIVVSGAKRCAIIPDSDQVLKIFFQKYTLYLCSLTPYESLIDIVRHRAWRHYFKEIFGYPTRKSDALQKIIECRSLSPDEILVVGDSESDRNAANYVGCLFYHINNGQGLLELNHELEI